MLASNRNHIQHLFKINYNNYNTTKSICCSFWTAILLPSSSNYLQQSGNCIKQKPPIALLILLEQTGASNPRMVKLFVVAAIKLGIIPVHVGQPWCLGQQKQIFSTPNHTRVVVRTKGPVFLNHGTLQYLESLYVPKENNWHTNFRLPQEQFFGIQLPTGLHMYSCSTRTHFLI